DPSDRPDASDASGASAPGTTQTWQNPAARTTAADKAPDPQTRSAGGYKRIATWIVLGLGLLTGGILWLLKKRHFKNFLAVLAVVAALIALVWLTDVQTADHYYAGTVSAASDTVGTVTLSIRCDALGDELTRSDKSAFLPADGIILADTAFAITEGETVFDLLDAAARAHRIQVDSRGVQVGTKGSVYVSGIAYLYEFDFGELSGWMYRVNGDTPSVGCGEYELHPGDRVEWVYSVNMGRDLSE
ncbi:MAG: DUF4430 domain-containing protein, partial [Clostridia bacterium]|nr:DUF4430 domain-containing protein [Clostridia bacterium]